MSLREWSTCANIPVGGPAARVGTDPDAIEPWVPGQKAALADVRWPNGSTVKVGFLNRPDGFGQALRQHVREIAPTWSTFANIKFDFVEGRTKDVTINFSPDLAAAGTYSSELGTRSALASMQGRPSMHLVFDPDNPKNDGDEFRRVILHEFGHALGLIHEHQRPDEAIVWDEGALTAYYIRLTDGAWGADEVRDNVMKLYDETLVDRTGFDPASIMMYRFPPGLGSYADGRPFSSDWNRDLSPTDRAFIGKVYPFA